jgi:hypothetical protein
MPSRKQRQRKLKSKRHEWETVWVDEEGNELDEAPPEALEEKPRKQAAKATADTKSKQPAGRGARREPQPPSWQRAVKRAALLGVVVFFLFSLTARGNNRYVTALVPAVIYTALFVPFTYLIDRFAYRRYQAKQGSGGAAATPRPAKKR